MNYGILILIMMGGAFSIVMAIIHGRPKDACEICGKEVWYSYTNSKWYHLRMEDDLMHRAEVVD